MKTTPTVIHTSIARACCRGVLDREIGNDAWGNWRKWARVEGHWATEEQFRFLLGIAVCRRDIPRRELMEREIRDAMREPVVNQIIRAWQKQSPMTGRMIVRMSGYHESWFYRHIPNFSMRSFYDYELAIDILRRVPKTNSPRSKTA